MASRRPPLFELLQQNEASRQGRAGGNGQPGVLRGTPTKPVAEPEPPQPTNGHASGAVESKPGKPARAASLEEIAAPAKPEREQRRAAARPEPEPTPQRTKPEPKPERPAGAADWSGMHPHSSVRVRMLWIYGAVVAVLLAVVGVWALGYNLGERNQKAELGAYLDRAGQPGPISDPLDEDVEGGTAGPIDPSALSQIETPRRGETQTQPPPERSEPPAATPDPEPAPIDVSVDVRKLNHNYLKLAGGMARERSESLANYLVSNGIPAMALPEPGQDGYGLYTAMAVPSGQFRATASEREALVRRVVGLLQRAPRDQGGPYDATGQYFWIRFDG
ncbi:MAG: hypothetical protein RIE77_07310 [Phycisphaerales bacterium]|jgi:hypothetical protein